MKLLKAHSFFKGIGQWIGHLYSHIFDVFIHAMKLYVCRNCVKISDKSDKKWRSYSLWNLISWAWPHVVRLSQADGRQGRVGGRVMVQCIDFFFSKLSNAIATKSLSCNMQRKQVCLDGQQTSVTHVTWWR